MNNKKTAGMRNLQKGLVWLLAAMMLITMLPLAWPDNVRASATEDKEVTEVNLFYDSETVVMDTTYTRRQIHDALRASVRTDEGVPYSVSEVKLYYDRGNTGDGFTSINDRILLDAKDAYAFGFSLDMTFEGADTLAWPDDTSAMKITLNGAPAEVVQASVRHLQTEDDGEGNLEMKSPERLFLLLKAPEVTGFAGVPEGTILFTEDSNPVKGGHITVDIQKMAVGNELLQMCFLEDGGPGYQWCLNGNWINNANSETLEITDDLFKPFEESKITVIIRYSTMRLESDPIIIAEKNDNTVSVFPTGTAPYYLMEIEEDGTITLPECELEPHDGLQFASWKVYLSGSEEGVIMQPGEKAAVRPGDTVFAVWESTDPELQGKDMDFTDVGYQYYYNSVLWAVANGITTGTSSTTFSPSNTCTRAQIVTFLWRMAGAPEPETADNPFADVDKDIYYYKPVLWAVERGITKGTDKDKFSPEAGCTRGQVVTFLHRYKGEPAPDYTLNPSEDMSANPFLDVLENDYFAIPVAWARTSLITNGVDETHFGPDNVCTRGQIVTFLYRMER